MARREVTVQLDGALVDAARVPEDELNERALREVRARDFAELMDEVAESQVAKGVSLTDEEAMDLAVNELRAMRAERRRAS
jgi:hypothetical protein